MHHLPSSTFPNFPFSYAKVRSVCEHRCNELGFLTLSYWLIVNNAHAKRMMENTGACSEEGQNHSKNQPQDPSNRVSRG